MDTEPSVRQDLSTVATHDETVLTVLAAKARARSTGQLATTLTGSGWAAGAIWWQHPGSWVGGVLLVVALYATWGILDRIDPDQSDPSATGVRDAALLGGLRKLTAGAGILAAIWTTGAFLHAALGHWVF
jgi:hypothetical protein